MALSASAKDVEYFTYTTLPGDDFIRLLTVLPSLDLDARMLCHIEIVALTGLVDYTALSYSWGMNDTGSSKPCRIIRISDRMLAIGQNLYEGLKRIRGQDKVLRIWIDAVCINQADSHEKSAQVVRMADIYTNASRVILWLGEGRTEDEDVAAFDLLNYFHDTGGRVGIAQYDFETSTHEATVLEHTTAWTSCTGRRTSLASVMEKSNWRQVPNDSGATFVPCMPNTAQVCQSAVEISDVALALFSRRYFRRRWVVQELRLPAADAVVVHWGPCSLPLERVASNRLYDFVISFSEAIRSTRGHLGFVQLEEVVAGRVTEACLRCYEAFNVLTGQFMAVESEVPLFLQVLHYFTRLECGDDRDRLFALSSLDPSFGLAPDYTLSAADTYIRFSRLLIEKGYIVSILKTLYHRSLGKKHAINSLVTSTHSKDVSSALGRLPSWVPDYRRYFAPSIAETERWMPRVDEADRLICPLRHIGDSWILTQTEGSIICKLSLTSDAGSKRIELQRPFTTDFEQGDLTGAYVTQEGVIWLVLLKYFDAAANAFSVVHVFDYQSKDANELELGHEIEVIIT